MTLRGFVQLEPIGAIWPDLLCFPLVVFKREIVRRAIAQLEWQQWIQKYRVIDIKDRAERVYNFQKNTRFALKELLEAAEIEPSQ